MNKLQASLTLILTFAASVASAHRPSDWQVRRLIRGTPIQSTNGIAVGPDGNLYIATAFGRQIAVVDRRNGAVLDRLGPDDGVETPDDLVFGPDGSLYWTSPFTGEVRRLYPDGTKSTIAQLPLGVNPIAFNEEGRLFVASVIFNDQLYELDPAGVLAPRLVLEGMGNLNGFAFGPDGLLYSPLAANRSVVRIDVNANTIETAAEGFGFPAAVDFDSLGRLYVNDSGGGEIVRIELATDEREVFATMPTGVDNITFDDRDHLYVTSLLDGSITEISPNGHKRFIHRGGMIIPGGVTTMSDGRGEELWVADFFSLRAFNSITGRQQRQERAIPMTTALAVPTTVSAYGEHRLVMTSWLANAVQVLDLTTDEIMVDIRDFAVPVNAIMFQGNLVVAELGTGKVMLAPMDNTQQRSALATQLLVPAGLAATDDDLWATDNLAGLLVQLVDDGQLLEPPLVEASGLDRPEGLAILPDGDLVVVEAGAGRLSRIDPTNGVRSTIADRLELGAQPPVNVPPTWFFNGVAVGSSGAVYVAGDAGNVVYKLQQRRGHY